jgi:hypothetical protein
MSGLTIDQMKLSPNARQGAVIVLQAHPDVLFTSGRRDPRDQARVMAENVIRYGVGWLGQTYKNQQMVQSLEEWMEQNLEKTASRTMMGEGFYLTLTSTQAGQLSQFPHCRGDAFDIQCPRFTDGRIDEVQTSAIRRTIERLPINLGLQLVITKEGNHRVIHAQFNHAVESKEV